MAFTVSQYLFKASIFTATTTATQGTSAATASSGYTVPAATRFSIIAMTLTNTSTTNAMAFADVSLYDGTTASTVIPLLVKTPLYPGGTLVVEGAQKHTLATGGAVYVTAYATNVAAIMSGVEIT